MFGSQNHFSHPNSRNEINAKPKSNKSCLSKEFLRIYSTVEKIFKEHNQEMNWITNRGKIEWLQTTRNSIYFLLEYFPKHAIKMFYMLDSFKNEITSTTIHQTNQSVINVARILRYRKRGTFQYENSVH